MFSPTLKNYVRRWLCRRGYYLAKTKPTIDETLTQFFSDLRVNSAEVDLLRIGSDGDGGYLLPDNIEDITGCLSPGVATSSDFEYELSNEFGMECFLADYSVDSPAIQHEKFTFIKKFLSSFNDDENIRLGDWIKSARSSIGPGDLMLQMDIEGAEYPVLLDTTSDELSQFRVMIIEFHYLERLFDRNEFAIIKQIFDRILAQFSIVHIHPNNNCPVFTRGDIEVPSVLEFTFLRRDYVDNASPLAFTQHHLDQKNNPRRPDLMMPDCWRA